MIITLIFFILLKISYSFHEDLALFQSTVTDKNKAMDKTKFNVVIVGGSVAGLTLAHCLARAGIQHVVLEKSDEIAPQVGASIGILPNGGRILDQLGLFNQIESIIEPLNVAHMSYPDGFIFSSSYPNLINERCVLLSGSPMSRYKLLELKRESLNVGLLKHFRFGYPIAFFDRQKLLEILYTAYPHKRAIRTGKRVVEVKKISQGFSVLTEDGREYLGDLVVGADGVHSRVRSEMWKMADALKPGCITEREKKSEFIFLVKLDHWKWRNTNQPRRYDRHDHRICLCVWHIILNPWPEARRADKRFL